eukprot:g27566.t1
MFSTRSCTTNSWPIAAANAEDIPSNQLYQEEGGASKPGRSRLLPPIKKEIQEPDVSTRGAVIAGGATRTAEEAARSAAHAGALRALHIRAALRREADAKQAQMVQVQPPPSAEQHCTARPRATPTAELMPILFLHLSLWISFQELAMCERALRKQLRMGVCEVKALSLWW